MSEENMPHVKDGRKNISTNKNVHVEIVQEKYVQNKNVRSK